MSPPAGGASCYTMYYRLIHETTTVVVNRLYELVDIVPDEVLLHNTKQSNIVKSNIVESNANHLFASTGPLPSTNNQKSH